MVVRVLSMPQCRACLVAHQRLLKLKEEFPSLELEEIDVSRRDDLVEQYHITGAPTLVFEDDTVVVGAPPLDELRRLLQRNLHYYPIAG